MAMQLRVYDTFRLKVEQRSDGPESDNIAQTRDAQFLTGIYEAFSDVHVLLVSLFGRPIVRSISHFFGWPIFFWSTKNQFLIFLVDQFFFWSTKNHFLMFLVDQETDQKYMDAANIKTFSLNIKFWS